MRAACLLVLVVASAGCHPSSRQRAIGVLTARDWRIEVIASELLSHHVHDFREVDEWTTIARLHVAHAGEPARDLGAMFAASAGDGGPIRAITDELRLASCSAPDGRVAFRLEGVPDTAPSRPGDAWWIGYALPSTFAIARDQQTADACPRALAQALPADAWVEHELRVPPKPYDATDPVSYVARLVVKGAGSRALPRDPAWVVGVREGLAWGAVLDEAIHGRVVAEDAALDATPGAALLADERAALLDHIAKGGLGEASPGLALLAELTPKPGTPRFPVAHADDLRIGFDVRVRWIARMAERVPRGEARDRAVRAILDGCTRPESRTSCSPLATWAVATIAREQGDRAMCDAVLGLVPGLVEAKVSALEWTVLGALRGVGTCGSAGARASAAAAALAPTLPELSAEARDPIATPSHEIIEASTEDCRAGLDPLDVHACHSLPGWARVVLSQSCGAEAIAAARAALARPREEWVVRGQASCVLARCAPAELPAEDAIPAADLDRRCPR